jgi:uncharacterized protein (TIGR03437 family)
MNATDGTGLSNLTSAAGPDTAPDWQTLPTSGTVSFDPVKGMVGTSVTITGSNFAAATSVTFNGLTAPFTVDSPTQITAVVPAGASTGAIAVTAPGGTTTSLTDFVVVHARKVSLAVAKKATGAVKMGDGYADCASGVPVKVQRLVRGDWKAVASVLTNVGGTYRAGHVANPGKYRAVARRTKLQSGDVCRKAISKVIKKT